MRHSTSCRGRRRSRGTGNRGRSANDKKYAENCHDATRNCNNCGGSFPHDGDSPVKNRKCYRCNIFGHYARFCGKTKAGTSSGKPSRGRGMPVYNMDSDSSEYSLAVHGSSGMAKIPSVSVMVNGVVQYDFLMDSGTTVDTLDNPTYTRLCDDVSV